MNAQTDTGSELKAHSIGVCGAFRDILKCGLNLQRPEQLLSTNELVKVRDSMFLFRVGGL